jgi:TPR repeat protein
MSQIHKRAELGDGEAYFQLGTMHYYGKDDLNVTKDEAKGVEYSLRAGELGCTKAYVLVAEAYKDGKGVDTNAQDDKKSRHYYELAAMGGNVRTRARLGYLESQRGDNKAIRHWLIGCGHGSIGCLENIKRAYMRGLLGAKKNGYEMALRMYQSHLEEIKSDQRDRAAAFHYEYKYLDEDDE